MLGLATVGTAGCGNSSHTMMTRQAETPPNILQAMRGGSRVGCDVSESYDGLLGIFIDCDKGRMVVGKPTGENMKGPDDPLQVTCFDGLGDPSTCMALWKRVLAEGAAPCGEGEAGPGCGELRCSGGIDQNTCEEVLAD